MCSQLQIWIYLITELVNAPETPELSYIDVAKTTVKRDNKKQQGNRLPVTQCCIENQHLQMSDLSNFSI